MEKKRLFPVVFGFGILAAPGGGAFAQGSMLLTGIPIDVMANIIRANGEPIPVIRDAMTDGLDYLMFGKEPSPAEVAKRGTVKIAYISMSNRCAQERMYFNGGYRDPACFDIAGSSWRSSLVPGAFDVVLVGSSLIADPSMQAELLAAKPLFAAYFNQGGRLFVMDQREYVFLPKLGSGPLEIGEAEDYAHVTPKGLAAGFSDAINRELWHSQTKNVDTSLFDVFMSADVVNASGRSSVPVSFGFRGSFTDSIFVPARDSTVPAVRASVPSGTFADSLCVDFTTSSAGAKLAYSLDGSRPATTGPSLPDPGRLCFRSTTTIRILGRKPGWIDGPESTFTYTLKPVIIPQPRAARPYASIPSGTSFPDSLCVDFASATPGATLAYSLDGAIPGAAPILPPSGRACFRAATAITLIARKTGHIDSDTATFSYVLARPDRIPSLELYSGGKRIESITSADPMLEARLALPPGAACAGCILRVTLSGGADAENFPFEVDGAGLSAAFPRRLDPDAAPGDGRVQHLPTDSLILAWADPERPGNGIRRAWPYRPAGDTLAVTPLNSVVKAGIPGATGRPRAWILSGAPGLRLGASEGCCLLVPEPLDSRHPDSAGLTGFRIEASRGFTVDLKVFSNSGQAVNQIAFTVTDAEFARLDAVPGKDSRALRLLWNGLARDGARAGNGVYILKVSAHLPARKGPAISAGATRRVGVLRRPG